MAILCTDGVGNPGTGDNLMTWRFLHETLVTVSIVPVYLLGCPAAAAQQLGAAVAPFPGFKFHLVDRLPGGYKAAVVDIDQDGKPDIVALATTPSNLVWYRNPTWERLVIDATFNEGHGLICADADAGADDEMVAGYRGKDRSLYIYGGIDLKQAQWRRIPLDEGDMAASGLDVADVDTDGRQERIMFACLDPCTWQGREYDNHSTPLTETTLPKLNTTLYDHFWFWAAGKEALRKSLDELKHVYYQSAGQGAVMLLNSTPNTDGLIPADDVRLHRALGAEIERHFGRPIARTDGRDNTVELDLGQPTIINHAMIMEDHWFGERVQAHREGRDL